METGAQSALFFNMTQSIDKTFDVSSNNIAVIPSIANAGVWGSNTASFTSNQINIQQLSNATILIAMSNLQLMVTDLSNTVQTRLNEQTVFAQNDAWLLSACVFTSNRLNEIQSMQLQAEDNEYSKTMYVRRKLNALHEFLLSHEKSST